ncbi:MAG: hypothetical protein IT384_19180 [Deltaproteobacteria bacterium]|nr:hypothetical protein [Deltaproteobacteria bacterium]
MPEMRYVTGGLVAAAVGLFSCGGTDPAFERLVGEHAKQLEVIRLASEGHRASIAGAADLTRVGEEEMRHGEEMMTETSEMQSVLDQMMRCSEVCCLNGTRMMRGVQDEVTAHRGTMGGSSSIDAARREEDRHQGEMDEELGAMDVDHASMTHMMGMGMSMGCEGSGE